MERIEEATIARLGQSMEQGGLTSLELTGFYMDRVARLDQDGPRIHAVLEWNPQALELAEAADEERRAGRVRGPIHGIPVLLKDNIGTADAMHTSAGSLALADHYARKDAFLVTRLREAGAVIIGKANMTEWANFMTAGMPSGYSSRGGQVLNPYGRGVFCAGGSSSGSGAAVSCNLTAVAVGTETSGSILDPAAQHSIVGIKPTVGRISRSGIIPLAHSQDTAGPMARTVADAAVLLGVLCGYDPADPVTAASAGRNVSDFTACLDRDGLRGARIGIPRQVYHDSQTAEELALFESLLEDIAAAGAVLVDPSDIPSARELASHHSEVLRYEFKSDLNAYLSRLPAELPVHSLKELIAFNEAHAEMTLRYGQSTLLWAEETSGRLTEPRYLLDRLADLRLSRTEGIDRVMQEHRLDALLFPHTAGDDIAAKAGYPSIAVPAGYRRDGSPFGVMFTGTAYAEPVLIRLAYAFEQQKHRRVPPLLE
ncbi:putative amidase [Paenibacillus mucilaginosus 3016]|uniref:Amidase n=2 Tax=Paenibacillus mucilaginosus TaxID=61624 RepID=I0BTG1_9BACL|nr:amidase family protein [Paenibacillus mucilaginosus]AFC33350.1 putative amidase [Paenibacillus mucilaginosus 3016]AFH65658.1 amidase [Paenibacillus mucilaginosus K02]WFA21766.1 amidase [Paenibacillus mucilaginosus]